MLSANITLKDASGDNVEYKQIVSKTIGEVFRIDPAKPHNEPRTLAIRHTVQGKGATLADRHNMVFSETVKDGGSVSSTGQISLTAVSPRTGGVTEQHLVDLAANLVSFLTAGAVTSIADTSNIRAWLRGEG